MGVKRGDHLFALFVHHAAAVAFVYDGSSFIKGADLRICYRNDHVSVPVDHAYLIAFVHEGPSFGVGEGADLGVFDRKLDIPIPGLFSP